MTESAVAVTAIAHQIQLAVAPVFLLAGIAGIINVLAHRLARVVDRSRALEAEPPDDHDAVRRLFFAELAILDRRMRVVNWSLTCCTAGALFVCVLVGILFVAGLANFGFAQLIAALFVLTMLLLVAGLLLFLYEVRLATRALKISRHRRQEKLAE
jgi:small-conductance mechanosensitive channel